MVYNTSQMILIIKTGECMMSIYLNNAATTWPKPACVPEAISSFILGRGANLARGSSSGRDIDTLDMVTTTRQQLARFFRVTVNATPGM